MVPTFPNVVNAIEGLIISATTGAQPDAARSIARNLTTHPWRTVLEAEARKQSEYKSAAAVAGILPTLERFGAGQMPANEAANHLRELLAALPAKPATTKADEKPPELQKYPASHYSDYASIPASRLDSARRDKRIRAEKIGGRWHYVDDDVRRQWPTEFQFESAETR